MSEPPATVVHTHADLEAHWRSLMEPLGFVRRALWIAFIADDGEVLHQIVEVSDLPRNPDVGCLDGLTTLMRDLHDSHGLSRYAFLLARPGDGGAGHADRAWASALHTAAAAAGVRCEPVHLATDTALTPIALDDLDVRFG